MASAADNVTTIQTTLEALYAKKVDQLSDAGRSLHYRDISDLEKSLVIWEARANAAAAPTDTGSLGVSKVTFRGEN